MPATHLTTVAHHTPLKVLTFIGFFYSPNPFSTLQLGSANETKRFKLIILLYYRPKFVQNNPNHHVCGYSIVDISRGRSLVVRIVFGTMDPTQLPLYLTTFHTNASNIIKESSKLFSLLFPTTNVSHLAYNTSKACTARCNKVWERKEVSPTKAKAQ